MFLTGGTSGSFAPTGGVPDYETSRDGGTEFTVAEGVESGAGAYEGPSLAHTRPLTDYYVPEQLVGVEYTEAAPVYPQGPNPYANTLGVDPTTTEPAPMATTTAAKDDCGCGKLPWYVLVGLVVAVVLLLRD